MAHTRILIVFIAVFFPFLALATETQETISVQRLWSEGDIAPGLYRVEDRKNNMVLYVYKDESGVTVTPIKMDKAAIISSNTLVPSKEIPCAVTDQKRQEIFKLMNEAGKQGYKGDYNEATQHYQEALSVMKEYVPSRKGHLEISVKERKQ